MPSADVLDQGMSGDHDPGAAVLLHAPHRPQPCLETAVVGLNAVVGVPIGAVPGRWQEVIEHHWVDRRPVSHDFAGLRVLVVPMACSKNQRAAAASRWWDTNTSMTCPN
jgi:hypothetical protein